MIKGVGEGANAVVCKARKETTGEIIALKLFHSVNGVESLSKREFLREINFSVELEHKNIVRTYRGDEVDGILCLELEFVDGVNLAQHLELNGRMEQLSALAVGVDISRALDFVWSNHLSIHRDVKPQNILIDKENNIKVCDFGMVTAHEFGAVDISAVEGTPYYLSPECVTEGVFIDNRSDIYSLGATMYHLITDVPPFDYDSLEEVIHARLTEPPPDLRKELPDADENVAAIIMTMMATNPEMRYVTAFECLEDMQRVIKGEPPLLVDASRSKTNS